MKICIDVSPAVHHRAGLGRYAQELTAALLAVDPDGEYTAFYNRPSEARPDPPLDRLPRLTTNLPNKPWRMSALLAHFARVSQDGLFPGADLFHATDHLLPRLSRVRSVFTLHDLIFHFYPQMHLPLNRWFLNLTMPRFLRSADAVIAVSECSKRDAVRLYGLDEGKIRVIYEGVNPRFRPVDDREQLEAIRRRYALPERFLLYVGTIEPRKNLPTLFEAFGRVSAPGLKLVIAGKKGWLYEATFARLRDLGLEREVVFTGFVAEEDLPGLYSMAEAFVFPSLYEGFGLPVLEAMACGVPVVAGSGSSLPEVAGEAALLVNPESADELARALQTLLENEQLRRELRDRGPKQAARFNWHRAARETLEVYASTLARPTHLKRG